MLQPGDLVWVYLRKDRFPRKQGQKLASCGNGPFRVSKRVNDNAKKADLLDGFGGVSCTFNVVNLSPYVIDVRYPSQSYIVN